MAGTAGQTAEDVASDGKPRSLGRRKRDALDRLNRDTDVWVATADHRGRPHLVPLSLCWDGQRVIVRVKRTSRTARNAVASGTARLALGQTRDVVMIDAKVCSVPVADAPEIAALYARRTGWDPSVNATDGLFLLLSPVRVQSWRDLAESYERTVMSNGQWVL
jgi:hypothetical protein